MSLDLDYPENDLFFGECDSIDEVIASIQEELDQVEREKQSLFSFIEEIPKPQHGVDIPLPELETEDELISEELAPNTRAFVAAYSKPVNKKLSEIKDRKAIDDLVSFFKPFERWEFRRVRGNILFGKKNKEYLRIPSGRNFTNDEDMALEFLIAKYMKRLHILNSKPIVMYLNLKGNTRHSRVVVERPELYNMIAPEVIIEEKLMVKDRSPDECYKRYKDYLENKIRNELLMDGVTVNMYQGRDPDKVHLQLQRNLRRKTGRYNKIIEKLCGKKSSARRRRRGGNRAKREKPVYLLAVDGSFWVCGRTYYEIYGRDPAWTDAEYKEYLEWTAMIQCNECENWFHPQCIGLKRNLSNIREDEAFHCPDCKTRIKKMKPEGLDISNIIGDINGIGGTRRSRYIAPIN